MNAFQLSFAVLLMARASAAILVRDYISKDGVVVTYGNTTSFITKDGNESWSFIAEGFIESTTCGSNGEVYISTNSGLTALTSDGKRKWKFTTEVTPWGPTFLATDDGTVFVADVQFKTPRLVALTGEGKQLWSSNLDAACAGCGFGLWLGHGTSEHLLFVRDEVNPYVPGNQDQYIRAIAKSDGSTNWYVRGKDAGATNHKSLATAVGKDGSLLSLNFNEARGHAAAWGIDFVAYSALGQLLWNHTLINSTAQWGQTYEFPNRLIVDSDGDVYTYVSETSTTTTEEERTSVTAFSSAGDKKWTVSASKVPKQTGGVSSTLSEPSQALKTCDSGKCLLITQTNLDSHRSNVTIMAINKDTGLQSVFHNFRPGDLKCQDYDGDCANWSPKVSPAGLVYLSNNLREVVQEDVILMGGGEPLRVVQDAYSPLFAPWTHYLLSQKSEGRYSMLALKSVSAETMWEYVFKTSSHSDETAKASIMI